MRISHNKLTFDEKEAKAVADVVRSGYWAGGPQLAQMEAALRERFGAPHAVGVGSGLAALRLALLALGAGEGDEVIVPAYSCVALANAVLSVGAQPIAVDVREEDYNIEPQALQDLKTNAAKAVIAVNTFGAPTAMTALQEAGLPVIEDCSHGFACDDDHNPAPIVGDMAVFSFYATKLIAGGEGGAVLSRDKNIAKFIKGWRDYTDKEPNGSRLNDKMTDIEASLVLCQLERLQDMLRARRKLAQTYHEQLNDLETVMLPQNANGRVWYRYPVRITGGAVEKVIDKMGQAGISVCRPVEWWVQQGEYQCARRLWEETISLPLYPQLTEDEQTYVCQTLKETLKEARA